MFLCIKVPYGVHANVPVSFLFSRSTRFYTPVLNQFHSETCHKETFVFMPVLLINDSDLSVRCGLADIQLLDAVNGRVTFTLVTDTHVLQRWAENITFYRDEQDRKGGQRKKRNMGFKYMLPVVDTDSTWAVQEQYMASPYSPLIWWKQGASHRPLAKESFTGNWWSWNPVP